MDRRDFLKTSVYLSAVTLAQLSGFGCSHQSSNAAPASPIIPLPYPMDALAPYISERTLEFHYGKHHQAYAANTVKLITGTAMAGMPLVEIIRKSFGNKEETALYHNAAQVFNHNFYWQSMKPKGGGKPDGKLLQAIDASFGNLDTFVKQLTESAAGLFGSGWTWLVKDGDRLKVINTADADTPVTTGMVPLLTLDVWEHAYYLDYQNRRIDYIRAYIEHLANWEFAAKNLDQTG